MKLSFTPLLFAFLLLTFVLPCKAQYAFNGASLQSESPRDADSGEEPAASVYKLIHGVVQGQQGALPGATVALKNSRIIAVTNAEGEFEMRVPATAKMVTLICGYGGLQEEVVNMAPVKALGSIYLLRPKALAPAN